MDRPRLTARAGRTVTQPGRRNCKMMPIVRLNDNRFVMTCWHCDFRQDLTDTINATEARVLIAKHNIREW